MEILSTVTQGRWNDWLAAEPLVAARVHARNVRHLWLGAWVSLPIYALAAAWLLLGDGAGWAQLPLWRRMVGLTHFSGVPVALMLALLLGPVVRQGVTSGLAPPGWTRALVWVSMAFYLGQGVAITVFYQWVSPKVTPLMVVCFGSAVMFQFRPWVAVLLYGGVMAVGLWACGLCL